MNAPDGSLRVDGYTISGELFNRGFPAGGGPCSCTSACCEGGVFADLREREVILAHHELIARHMDGTQSTDPARWFEAAVADDPDFPSGQCVGTQMVNDKCAFLDGQGRCTLQKAAEASGMHRWALKPLFCVLYPIEISDGTVSFDGMLQEEQSCCTIRPSFAVPLFAACRDELIHLLGEEGYAAVEKHYASLHTSEHAP